MFVSRLTSVVSLTEEWKTFSLKLNDASQQRIEALARVDEVETKGVTIKVSFTLCSETTTV